MRVATVLTACGIETFMIFSCRYFKVVATVLTACGIETLSVLLWQSKIVKLQQYLPLAVLKLRCSRCSQRLQRLLQQYLPLAVLKQIHSHGFCGLISVATVLTACGIETCPERLFRQASLLRCNSTYRLRY